MRLLVTGTSGQLAQSLLEAGFMAGVDVVALRRPHLDLTIPGTIRTSIADVRPDIIVNAAAYTAVDRAESEPGLAMAVNATGAGELAAQCAKARIPLVHLSTDYVFDGRKNDPYVESDPTSPVNAYGRSKLAGEQAVAAAQAEHVILRTSWIYSPFGTNFVRTMLRLAETRDEIGVVDDQTGAPTYAPHLAQAIIEITREIAARRSSVPWGVFHATGGGATTWCGFAREIFAIAQVRGAKSASVKAITTAEFPTPAPRPRNSRLDGRKLAEHFAIRLPDWRDGLGECMVRLT